MSVLFTDAFTRADNASLGANWNESFGTGHAIVSNALRMDAGGTAPSLVLTTTSAHAAIDNVKVTVTQKSATGDGGVIVRAVAGGSTQRGYYLDVFTASADIQRGDTVTGAFSQVLLQHNVVTQVANGISSLQASGVGATVTLTAIYQGVTLTVANDSSAITATAGRIVSTAQTGLHSWPGSIAATNDYDDFQVEDLGAASSAIITPKTRPFPFKPGSPPSSSSPYR